MLSIVTGIDNPSAHHVNSTELVLDGYTVKPHAASVAAWSY